MFKQTGFFKKGLFLMKRWCKIKPVIVFYTSGGFKMKFESKGNEYFVDEEFISWLHKEWKGYIVVVGGPSGVGKTTLSEKLGYPFVKPCTTREMRKTYETYDFITKKEYHLLSKERAFATKVVFKNRDSYGVTIERFKEAAKDNDVLIITMSPIGYRLLKTRYHKTIGIFVNAEFETVQKRLLKRDGHLDEVRVSSYKNNLRSKDYYHIQINNNKNIYLKWNVLKVRFLISLIKAMDKSKKGKKLRKKWFSVLKDKMFTKQAKERARRIKRRKRESELLSKNESPIASMADPTNIVNVNYELEKAN